MPGYTWLPGQTTFGTLLGSVTDASGAVVPNATIKVTNQGENTSRDVTSDANGNYQAENTKEGIYTLTVQAQGFSELDGERHPLERSPDGAHRSEIDGWRRVGEINRRSPPELINTESQAISASVTSTEVLGLPANYRGAGSTSPYNLLAFLPGVTGDNDGNISVQGTGTNQVQYTMDGIETSSIRFAGPQREMFPSAESISEMKVQGAGGGAEYGGAAELRRPASREPTPSMDHYSSTFRTRPWMLRDLPCPRWLSLPRAPTPSEVRSAAPSLRTTLSSLATMKACASGLKPSARRPYPTRPCGMATSVVF